MYLFAHCCGDHFPRAQRKNYQLLNNDWWGVRRTSGSKIELGDLLVLKPEFRTSRSEHLIR